MIVQIPLQADGPHMNTVKLHKTIGVRVGPVQVGGGAPVVVQSMTMTDTADAAATAQQCIELAEAGSEMVRVTVNVPEAAAASGTLTVTRTISEPASANSMHCCAVPAASAVSVMVIDWTTMGAPPPTCRRPTRTPTVL